MTLLNPPSSIEALNVFNGFEQAAEAVLTFLNDRIEVGVWVLARKQDDAWVLLQRSADVGYGLNRNATLKWSDTLCSRMTAGAAPRFAPNFDQVPAYRESADTLAKAGLPLPIKSYVGVPMMTGDGAVFGALCAFSPHALPESVRGELPLIELMSRMLSTVLARETGELTAIRAAEKSKAEANTDALTGLFNRRGFDELLAREEERCRRYGHDACVLSIDLNGLKQVNDEQGHAAGDEMIRRAAIAIKSLMRPSDIVARVGGDEFFVIAIECSSAIARTLAEQVKQRCQNKGVSAAVGVARRKSDAGFAAAMEVADAAMYEEKRKVKSEERRKSA